MVELTLVQKIILKLSGHVFIENRIRPGWRGPLAFYVFKCPEHGLVEDYPRGFTGRLECPKCSCTRAVEKSLE